MSEPDDLAGAAVGPRDRAGRVGRAPRRAPLAARGHVRRDRGALPRGRPGGRGWCSSSPRSRCCRSSRTDGYIRRVAFDTALYMLLALGLNVVVGWGGLLDLGYVAFYGIGAYAYAMLELAPVRHPPADARHDPARRRDRRGRRLPRRAAVAPPDRRLPGDRDALLPADLPDGRDQRRPDRSATTSRAAPTASSTSTRCTCSATPSWCSTAASSPSPTSTSRSPSFAVVYLALHFVNHSRTGRAWRSLREDPLAAEAMGMPVNLLKLMAFSFGAAVAALTGTLFASLQRERRSRSRSRSRSLITVYTMVILGGQGNLAGVTVGAVRRQRDARVPARPGRRAHPLLRRRRARDRVRVRPHAQARAPARRASSSSDSPRTPWPDAINHDWVSGPAASGFDHALSHWVIIPTQPRELGRPGLVHRPRLPRARAHARCTAGLRYVAARADALPRHVRVGERPARPAGRDALHRARRHADRAHDHPPERPASASAAWRSSDGGAPLLELRGVSLAFGGLKVVSRARPARRRGRDRERDRPERRRQDDALQPDHRHLRARRRRHPARRAQHRRPRAASDHPARRRPHVPDAAAVPQHVGARERDGRRLRPHEGGRPALDAAHAGDAARGGRRSARRPRSTSRSSASGSRATAGISRPTASPTPTAGGSRSRARWRPGRRSCCSTSPPPA